MFFSAVFVILTSNNPNINDLGCSRELPMPWHQNYDPCGSPWISTLFAAMPVLVLLGLLASGRVPAQVAALAGLITALLVAIFVFTPEQASNIDHGTLTWGRTMLAAALQGAAFGLFPIGWIVLAAIFFYSLTVHTGQFEIVKGSIIGLSADRRIQALLIAFSFGAFLEGAAGFGTPVAISAALLLGAGFRPLYAAGLALIANTAPVAFGALGTPIVTLAKVTELPEMQLSMMAGRQLPFFSLIVPAWLVWTMAGFRATVQVWPALLVCGGSFALVQFLVSNYHGPWLVDVAGGVIALGALTLLLRVWRPREVWRFPGEGPQQSDVHRLAPRQVVSAWVPWVLLTGFVFVWGLPHFKTATEGTVVNLEVPGLHRQVARHEPVASKAEAEAAVFAFNWLSATGTGIMLAALVSAVWMRIAPLAVLKIFLDTCQRMRWPLATIACMLAVAFTTRYSGMDATLGLSFTRTGAIYPLFAALLGWLGVALTGSDTSANALFGSLQTITAGQLVANGTLPLTVTQASVLMATANSTGGVMGKMIDAQSIVVATAATGQAGQEGAILRFVFLHSLVLATLIGLLVLFQAYVWTAAIPN
jgi:lactate permease